MTTPVNDGKYLLDTNAISDLISGDDVVTNHLASADDDAVTCAIVRGELQYGITRLAPGPKRIKYSARLTQLLAAIPCLPVTEQASDKYAEIRRPVELAGTPLDENDLWIAATVLSLGAILVTRDSDFSRIADLVVDDWSRPA